jgi:hypothetical protein
MCIPKLGKPSAHPLIRAFPELCMVTCMRGVTYTYKDNKLCESCWEKTRFLNFKRESYHNLIYGDITSDICIVCKEYLAGGRPLTACDECLTSYIHCATKLRARGITPEQITHLLYDVDRQKTILCYYQTANLANTEPQLESYYM